jgi:hypothetical protein
MAFARTARSSIRVDLANLVSKAAPAPGRPCTFTANGFVDLNSWLGTRLEALREDLVEFGALLFRGFSLLDEAGFREVIDRFCGTSGRAVSGDQDAFDGFAAPHLEIPFHNEFAHKSHWPREVFYLCRKAPASGGQTPLADGTLVYEQLREAVLPRFGGEHYVLVSQFGTSLSKPWQEAFGTEDRARVDAACIEQGLTHRWVDGVLITEKRLPLIVDGRPGLGPAWANMVYFFHHANFTLGSAVGLGAFTHRDFPHYVKYARGTLVDDDVANAIGRAYRSCAFQFDWCAGDVLLLDNHRFSHARNAICDKQEVLIGFVG